MPPLPSLTLRTAVPSLSSTGSAAASCCACKETVDEDGVIHMQVLMTNALKGQRGACYVQNTLHSFAWLAGGEVGNGLKNLMQRKVATVRVEASE